MDRIPLHSGISNGSRRYLRHTILVERQRQQPSRNASRSIRPSIKGNCPLRTTTMNRVTFLAIVVRLERKTIYKGVGLPFSELIVEVEEVDENPLHKRVAGANRYALRYNKTFHKLSLLRGDRIEFSANFSNHIRRGLPVLLKPTKVKKIEDVTSAMVSLEKGSSDLLVN